MNYVTLLTSTQFMYTPERVNRWKRKIREAVCIEVPPVPYSPLARIQIGGYSFLVPCKRNKRGEVVPAKRYVPRYTPIPKEKRVVLWNYAEGKSCRVSFDVVPPTQDIQCDNHYDPEVYNAEEHHNRLIQSAIAYLSGLSGFRAGNRSELYILCNLAGFSYSQMTLIAESMQCTIPEACQRMYMSRLPKAERKEKKNSE